MTVPTIRLNGKSYVVVEREEYNRLAALAKAPDLPPYPEPNGDGNYPAVEYARVSLARKIIRGRVAADWTQRELAKRAGISFEHLCRIESGKHIPSVPTIDKIDRALKQAQKRQPKKRK